jgi:hypothetical protein
MANVQQPTLDTQGHYLRLFNGLSQNDKQAVLQLAQKLTDFEAIVHNLSSRIYEMSCIQDGYLNAIKHEQGLSEVTIQNYVAVSTAIKEWHIHTQQVLEFEEAKVKFLDSLYGEGYVLGTQPVRFRVTDFVKEWKERQKDGKENS